MATSIHELYNRVPKQEVAQEITEPQDHLQHIVQAMDPRQIQLTKLQLKSK